MIRRPPRSTLFPTRRSSDLDAARLVRGQPAAPLELGAERLAVHVGHDEVHQDRKSTRLNSSHEWISYAVFCLKKKKKKKTRKTQKKKQTQSAQRVQE